MGGENRGPPRRARPSFTKSAQRAVSFRDCLRPDDALVSCALHDAAGSEDTVGRAPTDPHPAARPTFNARSPVPGQNPPAATQKPGRPDDAEPGSVGSIGRDESGPRRAALLAHQRLETRTGKFTVWNAVGRAPLAPLPRQLAPHSLRA